MLVKAHVAPSTQSKRPGQEGIPKECFEILNVPIAALNLRDSLSLVASWVHQGGPAKLVTFTNVHMIMEGQRSPEFLSILREMNLNCPDGKPLFWVGKLQFKNLSQVCGPDFMQAFCEETSRTDFQHFFYGGGPGVAEGVVSELKSRHPTLQIAGFYEPPFRPLSPREDIAVVKQINESGADIVWVCLGCPKQELWMYKHRHVLPGKVILAVGQAFDIVAGVKRRAPAPIRAIGLEWLYRLAHEPKRLFGRYAKTNSAFLVFVILDFLNLRKRRS